MEVNTGGQRKAAYNIGLTIWRLKCFYETFVQGSKAVILLNFCAKNPPHRQAQIRYMPLQDTKPDNETRNNTNTYMRE